MAAPTPTIRRFALALSVLALCAGAAQAHGPNRYAGPGYWGPGWFWGGVGLGVGIGVSRGYYYGNYGPAWGPEYVVVERPAPAVIVEARPVPPREPVAKPAPDPVIYPRNNQSAAQTEADRQECNRWATTQPSAMADASVFHRATLACMDGRGYSIR